MFGKRYGAFTELQMAVTWNFTCCSNSVWLRNSNVCNTPQHQSQATESKT